MQVIDKPLTLKMIILGLTVDKVEKARDVTGVEVRDAIGNRTNLICDPYSLSQFANGKSEISDALFNRIIEATNSAARVQYKSQSSDS